MEALRGTLCPLSVKDNPTSSKDWIPPRFSTSRLRPPKVGTWDSFRSAARIPCRRLRERVAASPPSSTDTPAAPDRRSREIAASINTRCGQDMTAMARRNVLPHARRRAHHACEACRQSKRKCDSLLPCYNCINKGLSASCTPAGPAPTGKGRTMPSGSGSLISSLHTSGGGRSSPGSNSSPQSQWPAARAETSPVTVTEDEVTCRVDEEDRCTSVDQPHRMLLNSRGERSSYSCSVMSFRLDTVMMLDLIVLLTDNPAATDSLHWQHRRFVVSGVPQANDQVLQWSFTLHGKPVQAYHAGGRGAPQSW